ncbi:class F sortase [Streptomyces sp. NPDC058221]|uniref:class F sortase n=1 Tax=Streptomyces sp. NPDC058221 TaxID=3346388 RepID=UPI0036F0E6C5
MDSWDRNTGVAPARRAGRHPERPPIRWRFPWELCLLMAAVAIVVLTAVGRPPIGPPQPEQAHTGSSASREAGGEHDAAPPMSASAPLRVQIPTIRVDAPLMELALGDDGRLAAPPEKDKNLAGWWGRGPTPGSQGTAIIAGHVDVPTGRAVFYDLGALKPGMTIKVLRADDSTAQFAIDSIDVYSASDFPNDKVYGDTGRPELRLITCGGGFDEQRRQYKGNVVVTAHLTRGDSTAGAE